MLVDVFPDSDNTYCGSLIDQGGYYKKFDVDCDISDYSEIKRKEYPKGKRGRYVDLAEELYLELRS